MPLPPPPPARPDAEKLRQNLIQAIIDKNTDQARRMIEAGFEYDMRLYPTPAMLFIAAHNDDRDTCRLLCAYGAAWSPEEASIFLPLLEEGSSAKNFLRRFTPKKPVDADVANILLPMIKDIESFASPEHAPLIQEWKQSYAAHCDEALRLARDEQKFKILQNIIKNDPDFVVDTAALIKSIDSGFDLSTRSIETIRTFQQHNIPLTKVDLFELREPYHTASMNVLQSWLVPLHRAGLLDEDQSKFRINVLIMYEFYFDQSENHSDHEKREYYKNRIEEQFDNVGILCSASYPVSKQEAEAFVKLRRYHDANFMKKISRFDYFSAPAFSAVDLNASNSQPIDDTLKRCFNYHAGIRRKYENPEDKWSELDIKLYELALSIVDNIKFVVAEPPGHYPHARPKPRPVAEQAVVEEPAAPQKKRGTSDTGPR